MDAATATQNGTQDESRRKSGRAIRRPDIFAEEEHQGSILSNGSAKRKRTSTSKKADAEDDDNDDSEETEDDDESESEPDEEETKERRRAQKRKTATSKPAAKRAKTANSSATLAIRSANIPSRPATKGAKTQKARARPSQVNKEGLFAEVFGRGQSGEAAATTWISSLRKDSVVAIRDLVNFVLECIGCEQKVASADIEDIDNVTNKLGDILEEYAQDKAAEYPLISKARQYAEFKTVLVDFFSAVIKRLHSDSILYDQPEIIDNINVWVGTMSGASYRPFRHTATVVALSVGTALCEVAKEVQDSMATTKTQLDAEKKKKSVNKGRVGTMQESMKAEEKKLEAIDGYLRDLFDVVYVHRYRDVEEKIRVECVAALGNWIILYRKMFLEGQYLRYLGWIMSDPHSPTRLEVIRQLKALFKQQRNIPALRAFTDRFRSRMVEMGARDADVSVRAESIELLDRLRNAELLEPDDIDTIGRLIFDTEIRVRKAVAKFFVANIEDLYKSSTEDFDQEEYNNALPEFDEGGDMMSPNQAWIRFKCLAQTLGSYDKDSASEYGGHQHGSVGADDSDTRYMLATQAIFPHMPELGSWESLAGYLLYDHSSISQSASDSDINASVQAAYKLGTGEEVVLLDVLYLSVKLTLASILGLQSSARKGGRTNATRDEVKKKQETAAHNLSTIIPQLLNRYGSTPQAATSILRLEQLLDVDLINDLANGEGGSSYSSLLEDINKQFTSHSDRKVLAEASKALRTARGYEQSKEAAEQKVQEIWDDASATLFGLLKGKNVETRGTLERTVLRQVVDTVVRCASLASVGDCSEILEAKVGGKKGKGKAGAPETLLDLMMALMGRGVPDEETTDAFKGMEDQLCVAVITVLSFYFRWKIVGLKNAIEKGETRYLTGNALVTLAERRSAFVEAITPIISARLPLDPVRVQSLLTTMDLFTLFATVKNFRPQKGELDDDIKTNLQGLTAQFDNTLWAEVMTTLERMEKALARKTNRKIELPSEKAKKQNRKGTVEREEETQEEIEKPPEDSDDEDNDSDDEDEVDDGDEGVEGGKEAKKQAALLAEQSLCEMGSKIVLAVIAGVVPEGDKKVVRERLQVNRGKLGKSYMQVIAYLDEKKEKGKKKGGEKMRTPTKKVKEVVPQPMEVEGDEIEDEEVEQQPEDDIEDDEGEHGNESDRDDDHGVNGDGEVEEDIVDDPMGD